MRGREAGHPAGQGQGGRTGSGEGFHGGGDKEAENAL